MDKVRIKLITALVWAYRHADITLDETGNDTSKSDLNDVISECKLTKRERNEFDKQSHITGI